MSGFFIALRRLKSSRGRQSSFGLATIYSGDDHELFEGLQVGYYVPLDYRQETYYLFVDF